MSGSVDSVPRFGVVLRHRYATQIVLMLVAPDPNSIHFIDEQGRSHPQWRAVDMRPSEQRTTSLLWASGPWETAWTVES